MRRKIVAGNWKMNKTPKQAVELIGELRQVVNNDEVDVIVCPTAVCLPAVLEAVKGTNIQVLKTCTLKKMVHLQVKSHLTC